MKLKICRSIAIGVALVLSSCNNSVRRLANMYERPLMTSQGHLFSASKLVIHLDSTFEFEEGGPAMKFSKGKWMMSPNKSAIVLRSFYEQLPATGKFGDPVFIDITGKIVTIKSKNSVEIDNRIFYLSK